MIFMLFKNVFKTIINKLANKRIIPLAMENLLKPPECVRGMTVLDQKLFEKTIKVPCIDFDKSTKVSSVLPLVKKVLFKVDKFKAVGKNDKDETRIYLNPIQVSNWENIDEDIQKGLDALGITKDALSVQELTLQFENYTAEDLLRAVLPNDKEGSSSFTKIGHIVHLNLREHLLPYKMVIGEILYRKVPNCRTVVNKTNKIDSTYRNFEMELLKGDDDMLTIVKEQNCNFTFDFSTVYWNSRLSTEHERIVNKLKPGDVLFDIFAGVGPFSIPAAKKKCTVFANDLNPESYKWLNYNKEKNKINNEYLKTYNLDGREFIKTVIAKELLNYSSKNVYITMNLPSMATEFLDSFVSLFCDKNIPENFVSPTIFVYCFSKGENYEEIAKKLVIENFKSNIDISTKIEDIFKVRTVSSMKEMMRVTVRLDKDILLEKISSKRKDFDGVFLESDNKKLCQENKEIF